MIISKQRQHIEQQIDRYIDGQLSAQEVEQLWSVLIQRQEYIDYLETAANLKEVKEPKAAVLDNYLNNWVYKGAAVIFALIVVFAVLQLTQKTQPNVKPIAAIELPFQRSANPEMQLSEHEKIIREAVLSYYKNDVNQATAILHDALNVAENPNWIAKLNTVLGIFYYNNDQFQKAANFFQKAASYKGLIEPLQLEKAYWYLGNVWFRVGKLEKAERAMHKVIKIDGAYSRVAKKYLEAIDNKIIK